MRGQKAIKTKNIRSSKMIQLLEVLSPLEMKRFKKFLESPFHNTNKQLIKLFGLIKKFHPTYNSAQLTKEKLYEKLFGKGTYRQQRMNDLIYDFRQAIEDFLIVSDTLEKKETRQRALVFTLANRNHPFFEEESEKLAKTIQQKPTYLTDKDYLQLHQIYDQLWFHVNTAKIQNESKSFQAAHENLDLFYVSTKLRYFGEQEGRKKIFNESEQTLFKDSIVDFADKNKKKKPILYLLTQIISLIQGSLNEKKFFELKTLVIEHAARIDNDLLRDLLLHLINYCIQKNNRGAAHFLKDALNIYKLMLDYDLILINGCITDIHFLNIANVANKCGEIEWSTSFQQKYEQYLNKKHAVDTINLTKVYTFFYQKKFKQASELINQINFKSNPFYYPRVKGYLIKGLYDDWIDLGINNIETIWNHAIAFEQFMKRDKHFSDEKSKGYLNFVKYVKRLVKLTRVDNYDKHKAEKLRQEIQTADILTYKDWLEDKINQLLLISK